MLGAALQPEGCLLGADSSPSSQERVLVTPSSIHEQAWPPVASASSSGGRRSRRTRATVDSLQADINAANALIAKVDLTAADRSAAAALIVRSSRMPSLRAVRPVGPSCLLLESVQLSGTESTVELDAKGR